MDSSTTGLEDKLYTLADRGEYSTLIKYIRNHMSTEVRYGAAGVLSESQHFLDNATPEMAGVLVQSVLIDPSDRVRAQVLGILLEIKGEEVLESIITQLAANPEETPTDTPYPFILDKWSSKPQHELRLLAVVGFRSVNSQSSRNKLLSKIKNEEHFVVLRRAIEEGGKVGNEKFVSPIQHHLRPEAYTESSLTQKRIDRIKQTAVRSLVQIGTAAAYEALVTAARSNDADLKRHAISEIGRFGAQESLDMVIEELDNEDDAQIREEAADGLLTAFTEAEFEQGDEIRKKAIQKISEEISIDVSKEFANIVDENADNQKRRNAAWLIGQVGAESEDVIDTLAKTVVDADDLVLAKIAAASLSNQEPYQVEEYLDKMKSDCDNVDSVRQDLIDFVEICIYDEIEEAKKEVVEYSYVTEPDDYRKTR